MLQISESVVRAMRSWLNQEKWHKADPANEERFYLFVESLWNQERQTIGADDLREILMRESPTVEDKERLISERVSQIRLILSYLMLTSRRRMSDLAATI